MSLPSSFASLPSLPFTFPNFPFHCLSPHSFLALHSHDSSNSLQSFIYLSEFSFPLLPTTFTPPPYSHVTASSLNVACSLSANELAYYWPALATQASSPKSHHSPRPGLNSVQSASVSPPNPDNAPEQKHKSFPLEGLQWAFCLNSLTVRHCHMVPNATLTHAKTNTFDKQALQEIHASRSCSWRGPHPSKYLPFPPHFIEAIELFRGVCRSIGLAAMFLKKPSASSAVAANFVYRSINASSNAPTSSTPTRNTFN